MVRAFLKQKQEIDADGDDPMADRPDWNAPVDADQQEGTKNWYMENYPDIEFKLRDEVRKANVQPVDTTSIVTKSDPIPLKDVKSDWLAKISDGEYCGHNSIIDALNNDTFDAPIEGKVQVVSRWALNVIDPELRNNDMCLTTDRHAQFAKTHRGATITSGHKTSFPSTELCLKKKYHRPIIGISVFHGGASAVVNNVAYCLYYGYMRCNLAQDKH